MNQVLLSVDLGTTRQKVAAFSVDGTLHHRLSRRHRDRSDGSLRWQDADAWWRDCVELLVVLLQRLEKQGPVEVLGIGLTGRGGAAVFADDRGDVLVHPWSDRRHSAELAGLRGQVASGALSAYAAAMLSKCLWVERNMHELAGRIRYAFYAKDFLLYRLTAEHATDYSSGPDEAEWNETAVAGLGVNRSWLPQSRLPWHLTGGLCAEAARALGLPRGTPVAVGAHDGVSANIGAGAGRPGDCALTLGTHAVVRSVTASVPSGANRFYGLPPDLHIIGLNALMSGRAADWFVDLTAGVPELDEQARGKKLRFFDEQAQRVPPGAGGLLFLPFLAGQVAPEWRPDARAVFSGLGIEHGRREAYRAVLEGSAFAIARNFEKVAHWCGAPARVRLTGSGAGSRVWTSILAAVLDTPLEVSDASVEGRGAVICLATGLGLHRDVRAAIDAMVKISAVEKPTKKSVRRYAELRNDWEALDRLHRPVE